MEPGSSVNFFEIPLQVQNEINVFVQSEKIERFAFCLLIKCAPPCPPHSPKLRGARAHSDYMVAAPMVEPIFLLQFLADCLSIRATLSSR